MVRWPPLFDIPRANQRFDNWFPDNYHQIILRCHNTDRNYWFLSEERKSISKERTEKILVLCYWWGIREPMSPCAMGSAQSCLRHWLQLTNYTNFCDRSETPNKLWYLSVTFQFSLTSVPVTKTTSRIVMFQKINFSHFCTAICTSQRPSQHQIVSPHWFLITSLNKCLFLSHPSAVWGIPIVEFPP